MKVLFVTIALAAISIVARAQGSDTRIYQAISITVVDHMDVKIDKENEGRNEKQQLRTNVSSSKSKSVIYSNYISAYRAYSNESLTIKGRSKERNSAAAEPIALVHTISAY